MARRRKRVTRIDAAVDAMAILGFEQGTVKRVARELLKVYDCGDEGWPFIEAYSYRELIDALLRDSNENDQEEEGDYSLNNVSQDKSYEDEGASGSQVPTQLEDQSQKDNTPLYTDSVFPVKVETENLDASLVVGDSGYIKLRDAMVGHGEANDQEKRAEDCDQSEHKSKEDEGACGSPVPNQLEDSQLHTDSVVPKEEDKAENWNADPASLASLSISHKKPCYGWIECDDEEPTQLKDTDTVVPIKVEAENWNANPASLASLPLSHKRHGKELTQLKDTDSENWNANLASVAPLPLSHERPCFGWIESDDAEPFEFICLKSPPLKAQKNQKSRWDIQET